MEAMQERTYPWSPTSSQTSATSGPEAWIPQETSSTSQPAHSISRIWRGSSFPQFTRSSLDSTFKVRDKRSVRALRQSSQARQNPSKETMVADDSQLPRWGTLPVLNRRSFLKVAGTATAQTLLAAKIHALTPIQSEPSAPVAANDHIQIALIGAGGQGQGDTKVAVQVPGVKVVAVADCYDGRLQHCKELWGNDLFHDPRLQRGSRPEGYRRRHYRYAGPLA